MVTIYGVTAFSINDSQKELFKKAVCLFFAVDKDVFTERVEGIET